MDLSRKQREQRKKDIREQVREAAFTIPIRKCDNFNLMDGRPISTNQPKKEQKKQH